MSLHILVAHLGNVVVASVKDQATLSPAARRASNASAATVTPMAESDVSSATTASAAVIATQPFLDTHFDKYTISLVDVGVSLCTGVPYVAGRLPYRAPSVTYVPLGRGRVCVRGCDGRDFLQGLWVARAGAAMLSLET